MLKQTHHRIRHFELLDDLRHPEDQPGQAKNGRAIGNPEDPDLPTKKRGLEIGVPVRRDLLTFLLHHPIVGIPLFIGQPLGFLRRIGEIEKRATTATISAGIPSIMKSHCQLLRPKYPFI